MEFTMATFNHAQDPYTAALEVLVLELAGALINAGAIDGAAFMARLDMYVMALGQGTMPKSRQGGMELDLLRAKLREIQPLPATT